VPNDCVCRHPRLIDDSGLNRGFRPPRFNFVVDSSIWGQARSRHGSTLSSTRLFGPGEKPPRFNFIIDSPFWARREAVTVQLCRRLAFLGPGERPPRFNFVVGSPFWGQARSHHGSTLSSTRLFGARREAATVQLCRRLVFLGPGEKPSRFNFIIDSPFWGQCRIAEILVPQDFPPFTENVNFVCQ
jgi:hypothetical protein